MPTCISNQVVAGFIMPKVVIKFYNPLQQGVLEENINYGQHFFRYAVSINKLIGEIRKAAF